jgi:hypothetical protein
MTDTNQYAIPKDEIYLGFTSKDEPESREHKGQKTKQVGLLLSSQPPPLSLPLSPSSVLIRFIIFFSQLMRCERERERGACI